jgi:hypothetical protein
VSVRLACLCKKYGLVSSYKQLVKPSKRKSSKWVKGDVVVSQRRKLRAELAQRHWWDV